MPLRRTIAIGDIHGCSLALTVLLEAIQPKPEDRIVALGDYIDRGPDSRGVLDQLLALKQRCRLIPLLGNHEEMLLIARADGRYLRSWLGFGGTATLASYGDGATLDSIPEAHMAFMAACRPYLETVTHLFLHAGYESTLPLASQSNEVLRWEPIDVSSVEPHFSGKIAIVGHTHQVNGEILDLGFLKCIDTHCYGGGWLTGLDVDSGESWQVNKQGVLRL